MTTKSGITINIITIPTPRTDVEICEFTPSLDPNYDGPIEWVPAYVSREIERELREMTSAVSVREDENNGLAGMLAESKNQVEVLRAVLHDIHTIAHCIAKAGPLNTPTLQEAWTQFMHISAMATGGLARAKGEE